MSKITKSVLMLQLLQNKRKWTLQELSGELGVTKRMIRYYKECLLESGINIITVKGKNGGYYLDQNEIIPKFFLSKNDINAIEKSSQNEKLGNKLKNNYYNDKNGYYKIMDNQVKKYSTKEKDFINAISEMKKIRLVYTGSGNRTTIRVVVPIDLFSFENNIYLLAFCELRNGIRSFDLNKIKEYSIK